MKRKHKFKFDVLFDKDRTRIDFDGKLSNEEIFCMYELSCNLINSLYWKEVDNEKTSLTEEQLHDLGITSSTLRNISDIAGKMLKTGNDNMETVYKILNKDDEL